MLLESNETDAKQGEKTSEDSDPDAFGKRAVKGDCCIECVVIISCDCVHSREHCYGGFPA